MDSKRGGSEGPQPTNDGSFGQGSQNGVATPMRPTFAANSMPSTFPVVSMDNTIMLAACREFEDLPQHPDLPADLFTACLTTPIRTALKWHWLQYKEHFPGYIDEALLDRIPGSHSNRMSLLGEINWIFTAVTDTIAWCSFSGEIFQKLFRQDLLVASLFRNFLLAERIMRMYGSHPCSWPALKPTHDHPMWSAWDHSLDRLFQFLPQALRVLEPNPHADLSLPIIATDPSQQNSTADTPSHLQELTSANSGRLTRLISQVVKMTKQTSSATAVASRADQEIPPPGYGGGRSGHQEKLLHHHHHHSSQGWRPGKTRQSSGPSTTDSTDRTLQAFSGTIREADTTANNAPQKRADDRLTQSAHYDCPHATPLGTNSHSTRPKFVIEPSSANEEAEVVETGDNRRGPTEKALSRISEEPSTADLTNSTAENARAPNEGRPQSCPPGRHSLLQTGAEVVLLQNAQKKECDSKGASEESEVSSNDLEDDDEEYEEDEDEEEEEEGEEYSGPQDAAEEHINEAAPPAPTQGAPPGAVASNHPQKQADLQKPQIQQQLVNVVPAQPVNPAAVLSHEPVGEGRQEASRGTQVLPPTSAGG
ncbi:unnamed protein product, partial [Dibothriocephalus latus]